MLQSFTARAYPQVKAAIQQVVVVNGNKDMLELLESVLDAGHYDVVFVAETAHAYSQIKQGRPDLVVLRLGLDDPLGFQLLSMLDLDPETSHIPVLTYTDNPDDERTDREPDDDGPYGDEDDLPLVRPELPMN